MMVFTVDGWVSLIIERAIPHGKTPGFRGSRTQDPRRFAGLPRSAVPNVSRSIHVLRQAQDIPVGILEPGHPRA